MLNVGDVHDVSGFLSAPASDNYLSLPWHVLPEIPCRSDLNTLIADKIYIFNKPTVRFFIISRLVVIVEIKAGILWVLC
jgi:hypothetical protein